MWQRKETFHTPHLNQKAVHWLPLSKIKASIKEYDRAQVWSELWQVDRQKDGTLDASSSFVQKLDRSWRMWRWNVWRWRKELQLWDGHDNKTENHSSNIYSRHGNTNILWYVLVTNGITAHSQSGMVTMTCTFTQHRKTTTNIMYRVLFVVSVFHKNACELYYGKFVFTNEQWWCN